jgi:hypothetical protein
MASGKFGAVHSYVWDRLIEAFTTHMLAGTTIVPDGQTFELAEYEQGVRYMAAVPRYMRRVLGDAFLGALENGASAHRFTRAFLPRPTERDQDTGFFFMTLAVPEFELNGGYEQYRSGRRNMLETYALAFLRQQPSLKRIVGVATEPPRGGRKTGSSEDLIVVETPEWTDVLLSDLEERKKIFSIVQPGNYTEYAIQGNEYPQVPEEQRAPSKHRGLNRRRRRAGLAEERRQKKRRQ